MIRKQCSRCVDVSVKFVGHDLHLSVARGRKLEFTAVGKGQGMDSLTISNGDSRSPLDL